VTVTPGTRFITNSAAVIAFERPTSFSLDIIGQSWWRLSYEGRIHRPEQELAIEITDVNRIHVDNMNVTKP
jgi:hypothetical protein